jgi:hypothetical protein
MLPVWIGLGVFLLLPFVALGAAIRPFWVPLGIGLGGSAIWIYGLGVGGFLAGAIGATTGVFLGVYLRRYRTARRARAEVQGATVADTAPPAEARSSEAPRTDTSSGGTS